MIDTILETLQPELLQLSRRVHANPELAFDEYQASAWTADLAEQHGFVVTRGLAGLPGRLLRMLQMASVLGERQIGILAGHASILPRSFTQSPALAAPCSYVHSRAAQGSAGFRF